MKCFSASQKQAARYLTLALANLGHKIFLSGGGAASPHLEETPARRKVKDLDFRIVLRYDFRSARGQLLLADINGVLRAIDPDCKGMRLDGATGLTIHCRNFLDAEVSISITELPVYQEFVRVTPDDFPLGWVAVGIVDGVYDKLLSIMFRTDEDKIANDLNDLLGLMSVSGKDPSYFVRNLFSSRGAAYSFSSKPAEIGRKLGKIAKLREAGVERPIMLVDAERQKTALLGDTAMLVNKPEYMMLTDLQGTLEEAADIGFIRSFAGLFAKLTLAVRTELGKLAVRESRTNLSSITPEGVKIKSDVASRRPFCVVAGRTLLGSWEV
jgi:hypothetical protein